MTSKKRKSAAVATKPRRASQRNIGINIDLAEKKLRDLMIEQCVSGAGESYLTVYKGSRSDLIAAGVPEAAFPKTGKSKSTFKVQTENACASGARELFGGSISTLAPDQFELEIDWGSVRPYTSGHPAIVELARMILIDLHYWTEYSRDGKYALDLEHTMDAVAVCPQASDYKPAPGAPRLKITPEFHRKLRDASTYVYQLVHTYCEVMPSTRPRVPKLRLVDSAVQS